MKEIPLTKSKSTLVDDEDFESLNEHRWCVRYSRGIPYALRNVGGGRKSKQQRIIMHRVIAQPPEGMEVDHINGDSLDNRRCNLRIVTRRQNLQNRRGWSGESPYKGVVHDKKRGKWKLHIAPEFDSAEEAAGVYDKIARIVYGDHAFLNFPDEE